MRTEECRLDEAVSKVSEVSVELEDVSERARLLMTRCGTPAEDKQPKLHHELLVTIEAISHRS